MWLPGVAQGCQGSGGLCPCLWTYLFSCKLYNEQFKEITSYCFRAQSGRRPGLEDRRTQHPQASREPYLGLQAEGTDGRDSDEGEALIQVLVGGASLQEGERHEVELPLQNQDQLPVPAYRAAGVHQALQNKHGGLTRGPAGWAHTGPVHCEQGLEIRLEGPAPSKALREYG